MAAGFDPYHRWLSIPPSEQPANHYRLLGVALFEANVEVIQNAAERQTRHVRSHLRSPLGAHAINLIREIEVARQCLIDANAKHAYDACLSMRNAYSVVPPMDVAAVHRNEEWAVAGPPLHSEIAPLEFSASFPGVPTITAVSSHRRKTRRRSPGGVLLMLLASGSIGLLSGYAVLCLIDPKYDFLHVMFRDGQSGASDTSLAALRHDEGNVQPQSLPTPAREARVRQHAPDRVVSAGARISGQPIDTTADSESGNSDRGLPIGPLAPAPEMKAAQDTLKPIILPFDLKKRVLRVVGSLDDRPAANLLCNIQCSDELQAMPLIDLPLGEKKMQLNLGMNDTSVVIEVSFLRRNDLAVVEIRPKYRLPSGDEEAMYKVAGVKKARRLAHQVSIASGAAQSLPTLNSRLSSVLRDYDAVSPAAFQPTTAGRSLNQVAAQRRIAILADQGAALRSQILKAEALSANLSGLRVDLSAIEDLGRWGAEISETATLAVCIHCDGQSVLAEVK